MEPKAFYSAREVAEVLDLHEVTVLRLLREGEIPAGKVGRQWRVSHAALEEMLGQRIAAGKHPLARAQALQETAQAASAERNLEPGPGRPEVTPGGILDLTQALRRLADDPTERHRLQSPDALRDLRHAERILALLRADLEEEPLAATPQDAERLAVALAGEFRDGWGGPRTWGSAELEALHRARLALQEAEDGLRRALGERQAAERFLDSIPSGSERQ